jgi:hypothetical protein
VDGEQDVVSPIIHDLSLASKQLTFLVSALLPESVPLCEALPR